MGIRWGGSYNSLGRSGVRPATTGRIRRLLVSRDGVASRRAVAMSPWADALAALRELHPTPIAGAPFAASLLDKPSGAPAHLRRSET